MINVVDAAPVAPVDARPILRRDASNIWERLATTVGSVYSGFEQACRENGIAALILKSNRFEYPSMVTFEAWLPSHGTAITERVSVVVTINPKPYFVYEFEYDLQVNNRGKIDRYERLHACNTDLICAILRHLCKGGPKPNIKKYKLAKEGTLDFLYRPKNEVAALRPDYLTWVAWTLWIVGLATISLFGLGVIVTLAGAALSIYLVRRPFCVRGSGKPASEPRTMYLFDTWQTVVFDAGSEWSSVKSRFLQEISAKAPGKNFTFAPETIWHRGLDGIEEREQIRISYGRGIVYCHIYKYGNDLFIGWDGYLNSGQWHEQTAKRGIDRETGRLVAINIVVPGIQKLSEYDLIDLSTLMEWTHANLTNLLKAVISEKKIDQEIDFKIIRGDRQQPFDRSDANYEKSASTGAQAGHAIGKLFKRTH